MSQNSSELKGNLLIIPASIKSHVVPAFSIAEKLKSRFKIHFAVANPELSRLVKENGYVPIEDDFFRVATCMEWTFVAKHKGKTNFKNIAGAYWSNIIYKHRKKTMSALIEAVKPTVVIIDIFNITDYPILFSLHPELKILFYNPMLSTYKANGVPAVNEGNWKQEAPMDNPFIYKPLNCFQDLRSFMQELLHWVLPFQFRRLVRDSGIGIEEVSYTTFGAIFEKVPELILAPAELEFSLKHGRGNQYYMGLCIDRNRKEISVDDGFLSKWTNILHKKKTGERIVYCSFGTYYNASNQLLEAFLLKLLEAIGKFSNVQLICSVRGVLIDKIGNLPDHCRENIHLFTYVPQLAVLQEAHLHISHGGLGSVKESIYYGVPMLIYPLDLLHDQGGNSLKVEYHGIGLAGNMGSDQVMDIQNKVSKLLTDESFLNSIILLRKIIEGNDSYTENYLTKLVTDKFGIQN
ncbi:glycosyltransferase [Dyadobacter sp. CY261]|uniref:glycosyltransferase n=1 Tax=Dyadobacter sp. CY261 TaxID=2907203 RepID=UPI001F3E8D21|nr:glycosyltransferase [Dyadobacter sp. CY261]MCF0072694.1 glycosyltransferase [Dyadobacter sp. CY261]